MKPLANLEELTPERLTDILHNEGHLAAGHVESIDVTSSTPIITSTIAFLDVTYSSAASAALPKKLFLKFANPNHKFGRHLMQVALNEESYYRKIAPRTHPQPSRDILDVQVDTDTQQFHLLMADVSDTHFQYGRGILPPTRDACEQLFGILATFHAQWWDHPDLGTEIGQMPEADHVAFGVGVERIRKAVKAFVDLMGEFLSPARKSIYERILDAIPELRDLRGRRRLTEGGNLTLIHEDAHLGNVFFPRDPKIHDPFLIDWQTCRVHAGTNDVANLVLFWYPERRRAVEKPLVEHYHRTLVEAGVRGYTWEDCWHDYRLSGLRMMLRIPMLSKIGVDEGLCYQWMEGSFLNFEDLALEELL